MSPHLFWLSLSFILNFDLLSARPLCFLLCSRVSGLFSLSLTVCSVDCSVIVLFDGQTHRLSDGWRSAQAWYSVLLLILSIDSVVRLFTSRRSLVEILQIKSLCIRKLHDWLDEKWRDSCGTCQTPGVSLSL